MYHLSKLDRRQVGEIPQPALPNRHLDNSSVAGAKFMEFIVANLLNGISYGTVLFLIASGLSIVIGIMGIGNHIREK